MIARNASPEMTNADIRHVSASSSVVFASNRLSAESASQITYSSAAMDAVWTRPNRTGWAVAEKHDAMVKANPEIVPQVRTWL